MGSIRSVVGAGGRGIKAVLRSVTRRSLLLFVLATTSLLLANSVPAMPRARQVHRAARAIPTTFTRPIVSQRGKAKCTYRHTGDVVIAHCRGRTRVYWSEAYAEQRVLAKVKILYCKFVPDDPGCVKGGRLRRTRFATADVSCLGSTELGTTFKYNRFRCDVAIFEYQGVARIGVQVTGVSTFVWQVLDVSCFGGPGDCPLP